MAWIGSESACLDRQPLEVNPKKKQKANNSASVRRNVNAFSYFATPYHVKSEK
jgi:hypothetical protein